MQWGPEADAKFFMHVLKIHNIKLDYKALALAMGQDVTPKALVHRIARLRAVAQDAEIPADGGRAGKRKRAGTESPAAAAAEEEGDGEGAGGGAKRAGRGRGKGGKKVKRGEDVSAGADGGEVA